MKTNLFSKNRKEQNYALFFEPDELPRLQYLLETKQFLNLSRLDQYAEDNTGIKLEISLTNRGKRATVQLFEYIVFSYVAVSPVMTFHNKEAMALSGAVSPETGE